LKEIKNLNARIEKLSGVGINWPNLTMEEREHANAISDESGIPEAQLTPVREEDWVKKHRLEQETEQDRYLARQKQEDIALAVDLIRKWFPGELTERGERTGVALLLEACERHSKNHEKPGECEVVPGWVFSCVPNVHKTRKGLIHQYRTAIVANPQQSHLKTETRGET
jgi:hypothetical protein